MKAKILAAVVIVGVMDVATVTIAVIVTTAAIVMSAVDAAEVMKKGMAAAWLCNNMDVMTGIYCIRGLDVGDDLYNDNLQWKLHYAAVILDRTRLDQGKVKQNGYENES